jgi:hypothetical protein
LHTINTYDRCYRLIIVTDHKLFSIILSLSLNDSNEFWSNSKMWIEGEADTHVQQDKNLVDYGELERL